MLGQACKVLESAEDSFDRDALLVGASGLLRSVALEFPVDSEDAFDAFLLASRIRNNRHRSLLESCVSQPLGTVLRICHQPVGLHVD